MERELDVNPGPAVSMLARVAPWAIAFATAVVSVVGVVALTRAAKEGAARIAPPSALALPMAARHVPFSCETAAHFYLTPRDPAAAVDDEMPDPRDRVRSLVGEESQERFGEIASALGALDFDRDIHDASV